LTKLKEIKLLLLREIRQEWRQRFAINGILLYLVGSVFIASLSFKILPATAWNALFWIILLFASVSAVAKSFIQESKGKLIFFYQLVHPVSFIISKLLYNIILMILLSLLSYATYVSLLGSMANKASMYVLVILVSSIWFASILTTISAIAAQAGNSHVLMPVLSFPLLIPLLLVGIKAAKSAMDGTVGDNFTRDVLIILLIDGLIFLLSVVLFKYLWKD
jgi:heme exporter protein B